MDQIDWCYFSK